MLHPPLPMLAPNASVVAFTNPDWLYEIKFDGYRTLAAFGGHRDVDLRTKSGAICTAWYPEVVDQLAAIGGGRHIVDGEACVLDELGRSDFQRQRRRASHRRWYRGCDQVTLMIFDLLVEDGRSIMDLPLVERKARLARLLAGVPKRTVVYVGDFPAEAALYRVVLQLRLEGLMAKRKASAYQPGVRSRDWLKIKRPGAVDPQRFRRP